MDKEKAAKALYMEGATGLEISKLIDVSEQTISKWKKAGRWEEERRAAGTAGEHNEAIIRRLIAHQLRAIEAKIQSAEIDGTTVLLDKGHVDAVSKLYAAIKRTEISIADYYTILSRLIEFIAVEDMELAKHTTPIIRKFIKNFADGSK